MFANNDIVCHCCRRVMLVVPLLLTLAGCGATLETAYEKSVEQALGNIPDAASVDDIPNLVAALKHEDDRVVRAAAEALAELGPRAEPAIPALVESLTYGTGGGQICVTFNGQTVRPSSEKGL